MKIEDEMRALLDEHHTCVVTAVPDPVKGERLVAFYTDPGIAPQDLWERLCRTELPRLWLPKREDLHHIEAVPDARHRQDRPARSPTTRSGSIHRAGQPTLTRKGPVMSFLVLAYLAAGAFLLWRTSKMEAEIDDLIARVRSLEAQPRPVAPSVSPTPPTPHTPKPMATPVERVRATPQPAPQVSQPAAVAPGIAPAYESTNPASAMASLESRIGSRWLLYVGVIAIVVGVSYFEKLAIDSHWVSETARTVQGGIVGLLLVYAGLRFVRAGYAIYGQMISGGGIAVLYVSTYAAFNLYQLIDRPDAVCADGRDHGPGRVAGGPTAFAGARVAGGRRRLRHAVSAPLDHGRTRRVVHLRRHPHRRHDVSRSSARVACAQRRQLRVYRAHGRHLVPAVLQTVDVYDDGAVSHAVLRDVSLHPSRDVGGRAPGR